MTVRLHRGGDRREVVVGEHHGGGLAGDVGAGLAHGDADVGAAQRGCVVDAVAGHRDDLAQRAQGVGDPQLRLGRAAGEDDLGSGAQEVIELRFGHRVQVRAVHDPRVGRPDPFSGVLSGVSQPRQSRRGQAGLIRAGGPASPGRWTLPATRLAGHACIGVSVHD
jgi:hypothetical protein